MFNNHINLNFAHGTGVFVESFEQQSIPCLAIGDIVIKIYTPTQEYLVEFSSHDEVKKILEDTSAPFEIELLRPSLLLNGLVEFVNDPRKLPWLLSYLHQELLDDDPSYYEV